MSDKKINGYVIHTKSVLGKGSYGSVYLGHQDITKLECAVKVLQKKLINQDEYLKSALLSEIQILQLLKSQNIVRVIDVMESSHNYYIIQQICDSDLEKQIAQKGKFSETEAINILKQICNGFLSLVKEGIVHRDVKPANLLMSNGIIKIGDFGFAKKNVTKRMKNATAVGTPLYMPVQILKSEPYTSKCDIWAVGFIFYEMLHGKTPWTAQTEFQLVKNIENKALVINQSLKPQTKDFLTKCLQVHEKDRIFWDEVFLHPIFKGQFHKYAEQNQYFQDKLKMVMTDLRIRINSNNINLTKLLENLGFKNQSQLSLSQFSEFINHIHPDINKDEMKFFFEEMDDDGSGSISIKELEKEMAKHFIAFNKTESLDESQNFSNQFNNSMNIKKMHSHIEEHNEEQSKLSIELERKAKKCFLKLYKIITTKNITLFKTFFAYDTDKSGELGLDEFNKILKKLDPTLDNEQLAAIFEYIDVDHSKTIQYDELVSYYCKVNGIPPSMEMPPEHLQHKIKRHH